MKKTLLLLLLSIGMISAKAQQITLKINEFVALNDSTSGFADPFGQYDDWIELYNYGTDTVDLAGLYITDNLTTTNLFRFLSGNDSTKIPPKGFIVLWADKETTQGILHINLKLSGSGEQIGLFSANGIPIDTLTFGPQTTNVSMGRYRDGGSAWVFYNPTTPGRSNSSLGIKQLALPADYNAYFSNGTIYFATNSGRVLNQEMTIYSIAGQAVYSRKVQSQQEEFPVELPSGIYLVRLGNYTQKILIH